jgi:phosphopantetheinyl transferase (holo-ACP synthase)
MIGNDIIDLQLSKTESNWQRRGWLAKLFCQEEQSNIKTSETPETLVWLYWSMKEAAYKIQHRQTGKRSFAPAKLQCNLHDLNSDTATGRVTYEQNIYYTESCITKDFIHTIAKLSQEIDPLNVIIGNKNALTRYPHFALLKDSSNLPYILDSPSGKAFIASNSHHGKMEAVVFSLKEAIIER